MTITQLSIVQDCWWVNGGDATNYVTNDLGQKNSEITNSAFYKAFSPSPTTYLQFNGSGVNAPWYHCRLETSNMVPEQVRVGINGSCANGNTWATVGINGMEIGSFGNFGSISTQSGVFNLTTVQKERILNGRISDNYDYLSVRLERSGVLSSSRIVDFAVHYSGNSTWDNYSTGLSGIQTLYCYPNSLSFRNNSIWANQSGSIVNGSGFYHISVAPSSVNADTLYITHTNPPGYASSWAGSQVMFSGGLSLVFGVDGLDPLTQVTRAKIHLRMSLSQSGTYPLGHYRDTFEINGYNARFKNQDYIEEMADAIGSVGPRDNKYGYFVYGAGATVEQSGFKTYTTELNFLNPNLPNGNLASTVYKNIDIFNTMELKLVGLPSGVQLSAAQLELEYIPNDTVPLYTAGNVVRTPVSVYPDYSGVANIWLGNGKWHHRGSLNEGDIFDCFYTFAESSGTRTYPITNNATSSGIYGEYRYDYEPYTTAQEPIRHNYYRSPIQSVGAYPVPTYYRDAIANSGTLPTDNVNVMFDDRMVLGTDFTLYFMLYRQPDHTTSGHFFNRGTLGGTNWEQYEIIGYLYNQTVVFHIKSVTSDYNLSVDIDEHSTEPILVWLTCSYSGTTGLTTFVLYAHSSIKSYFSTDWAYDTVSFPGYRRQITAARTSLGSLYTEKLTNAYIMEFGYANTAIPLSNETSSVYTYYDYTISDDLDKQFFSSRLCNAKYLSGDGVDWSVPVGSGAATFSTNYYIDDWTEDGTHHSLFGPVTTAGTHNIVHPSAIYVDLIASHTSNHPSGVKIYVDVEFDSGSTDNWKVFRTEFDVFNNTTASGNFLLLDDGSFLLLDDGSFLLVEGSGTAVGEIRSEQTCGLSKHIGMGDGLIRYSDVDNITARITTRYADIGSSTYYGDLSIESIRVHFDSYTTSTDSGFNSSSGNATLYTIGSIALGSGIDLYTFGGWHSDSGNIPLYTNADYFSTTMPLYIYSKMSLADSGNIPLFMYASAVGVGDIYSSMPLLTAGIGADSLLPLYLLAPTNSLIPTESSGSISFYMVSDSGSMINNMTLYLKQLAVGNNLDLYLCGQTIIPSSIPLYIFGSGLPEHQTIKLYTHGF